MSFNFTLFTLIISFSLSVFACSDKKYQRSIKKYRVEYKEKFNSNDHAPLKGSQLDDMRFYESNSDYKVIAIITKNSAPIPFDVPTSSGMIKSFHKYADASFSLLGKSYNLEIYQNLKSIRMPQYKTSLFLPFTDYTNGESTYGGGRYIDLKIEDIVDGKVVLDFNKCYNPYCAYSAGYNCPIPPLANKLKTSILAGEKLYAGKYIGEKHHE